MPKKKVTLYLWPGEIWDRIYLTPDWSMSMHIDIKRTSPMQIPVTVEIDEEMIEAFGR